jgi:polyribonucleotide nucleotidyltransferase
MSIVANAAKEKHAYESCAVPEELFDAIREEVPPEEMEDRLYFTDDKQTREENIDVRSQKSWKKHLQKMKSGWLFSGDAVYQYQKKTVRKMILKDHKRPDGREITRQIRPLAAEIDLIPESSWFCYVYKRTDSDLQRCRHSGSACLRQQKVWMVWMRMITSKRYMHHYNFPSYSVGETKPSRGPGRREIGHGALAESALIPVLPSEEEFPYAIRTVSETFESNGSTSQASVPVLPLCL